MIELSRLAINVGDFHPRVGGQYVPACTYVADGPICKVSLGTPAIADTDALLLAAAMDLDLGSTETFTTFTGTISTGVMDATYGRNITITQGDANAIMTYTIKGFDYLMQPITETFTVADNATTGATLKAFKVVTSIAHNGNSSAAVTGYAGFGDVLGLPYKTVKVLSEETNGAVATVGTLVTPVLTDPQTATTGDPRGTYDPNSTLDGSAEITITAVFSNEVVSGNGGYFGIRHYTA